VSAAGTTLHYEFRVRGRVADHLADALGLVIQSEPVESVLHGPVSDPDSLCRLLGRLQDLGLEPLEIRRLPDS
jgi:hypothetical protein